MPLDTQGLRIPTPVLTSEEEQEVKGRENIKVDRTHTPHQKSTKGLGEGGTTIPAQVKIPPSKAPDHEIGGADNMSQHEQRKDQHKEPLTSVSSPNESPPLDSKALANVTIADKFKKYPGFIHPYKTYIHDGLTFVVESFVSAGGFGSVFKVMNGAGVFAIKAQKAGVSIERDRQIRSEARFLKRSAHANVVQFFGEFRQGDHLCLRLEWMPKNVHDIIKKRATLLEVQKVILGAASGLSFLHGKNFVHRDIKPENVLVSGTASQMVVKLADFGLAGYMKDGRKLRGPCGTRTYQAPEMLENNGKKEYGSAVDLYSLGVILRQLMYNMLPCTDLDAITIGKELIVNLTDKEDRRLSAEEVIDHPFLSRMILTAVQQENKQEKDSVKESNVAIVEEKTKRPREPSEEKQEMGEKPEDDVSPTDAKKFKNRKQSDIRRREQDRTTEIQKESLIAGSTPKHKLDDDIGEVEEKEAKKPKLTPDPARSTQKIGSASASANSVKGSILHPEPSLSPY
ncbi:hypothetical protein BGZ91_010778 [Linnemannia elongata]|nr:hypothetical protein BGZ91_010778 [Linnemannia elongata]